MDTTEAALAVPPTVTSAGWHPDPLALHLLRYFDGSDWTGHVTHAAPVPCSGCRAGGDQGDRRGSTVV